MVHQHFSLVEPLRVWENVALGDDGRLDPAATSGPRARDLRPLRTRRRPDAVVGDLPVGMRQRVEIIKCLRRDPSILIFDEPTSVLTPAESEQLFDTLAHVVVEEGRAVALVSHKLDEIMRATDEVTIMRQGAVVDEWSPPMSTPPTLATSMVGRTRVAAVRAGRHSASSMSHIEGTEVPRRAPDNCPGRPRPRGSHASARAMAASCSTTSACTFAPVRSSAWPASTGTDNARWPTCCRASSRRRVRRGPCRRGAGDDRVGRGDGDGRRRCDPRGSSRLRRRARHDGRREPRAGRHRRRRHCRRDQPRERCARRAEQLIAEFDISCSGPDAPLYVVVGGNQQRVVLARELSRAADRADRGPADSRSRRRRDRVHDRSAPTGRREPVSASCSSRVSSRRSSISRTGSS